MIVSRHRNKNNQSCSLVFFLPYLSYVDFIISPHADRLQVSHMPSGGYLGRRANNIKSHPTL